MPLQPHSGTYHSAILGYPMNRNKTTSLVSIKASAVQVVNGFTLIELLIVVAIIGILAAIGYPAYTSQVRETNRQIAVGEILDIAAGLERVKSQRFSYPVKDEVVRSIEGRYNIQLQSTASTYTLSAIAIDGQIGDKCGTLSYDHESVWSVSTVEPLSSCVRF